jgi:hypothetical protein
VVEVKKKTTIDIVLSKADVLGMVEKYILSHKTDLGIGRGHWRVSGEFFINEDEDDLRCECILTQVDDA